MKPQRIETAGNTHYAWLLAVAVHPENADHVAALTKDGVIQSRDADTI